MKPKYTDTHRYPRGYNPSHDMGPNYLKTKFEAIRRQQRQNEEERKAKVKIIPKERLGK